MLVPGRGTETPKKFNLLRFDIDRRAKQRIAKQSMRVAMRRSIVLAASVATAAPLAAQAPRVPVPIIASDEHDGCSTAYVYGLDTRNDGVFLAVRAGPSRRERELDRLRNGDQVYACIRDGDWFGIVYEGAGRTGCNVRAPQRVTRPYAGPCRSGWVHERWLGGYADWVSP